MASKRGASDYLTKDGPQQPFGVKPENQVQMATAAQLAKRRIAAPKPRGGRATTSAGSPFASTSSNPFASANGAQQQQPTFGGVGGVQFGNSQSFPPSISASSGGFNFQAPAPFAFGQSSETPTSNPFSNANGNGNHTQNNAQSEDAMMESPQKRQNTGLFGANNTSTSGNTPFNFGQPQQTGGGIFGTSQANSASIFGNLSKPEAVQSGGLFDRISRPEETAQATLTPANMFTIGQPTPQASTNLFGSTQTQSAPSSFNFGSGSQPSTDKFQFGQTQSQTPNQPAFKFGQSQPSNSEANKLFGGFNAPKAEEPKPPLFNFGQAKTTSEPRSNIFGRSSPAPAPTSNLFDQSNSFSQVPVLSQASIDNSSTAPAPQNNNIFGSLFGQNLKPLGGQTEALSSSTTATPGFTFGSTTQTDRAHSPSGHLHLSEKDPENTPQPKSFMTSYSQGSEFATPSWMSGSTMTNPSGPVEGEDSTSPNTSTTNGGFSFTSAPVQANSGSGALFGNLNPSETTGSKTADLFSRMSQPAESDQNEQWQGKRTEQNAASEPVSSTKSLFGTSFGSTKPDQGSSTIERPPAWGGGQLFSNQSQTANNQQNKTDSSLRDAPSSATSDSQISIPASQAAKGNDAIFAMGNTAQAAAARSSTLSGGGSSTTPAIPKPQTTGTGSGSPFGPTPNGMTNDAPTNLASQANDAEEQSVKLRSRTNGPGHVPRFFDNDQRAEHDKTYRLISLDHGFSRMAASVDSTKHDFGRTVRMYIAARESISEPVGGLYTRATAGSKRKADDGAAGHEDVPVQSKKAKSDNLNAGAGPGNEASATSTRTQASSSSTSSLFQDMISNPAASTKNSTVTAPVSSPAKNIFDSVKPVPPSFGASSGFQPSSLQASNEGGPSTSNIFASIGRTVEATPTTSTASSTGFRPTMPSTTPTKSPPKKLSFEIPKFGASSTTNFMAAFTKQAEDSVAKEAAKRKAEEYDSDDETEAEYEARKEEEAKQKKAKLSEITQSGFKPSFGSANPAKPASSPEKTKQHNAALKPGSGFTALASSTTSNPFGGFGQTAKASGSMFGSAKPMNESVEHSDEDSKSPNSDEDEDEESDEDYDPETEHDEDAADDLEEAGDSGGNVADDDGDDSRDDSGEDMQAAMEASRKNKGKSLFDRITRDLEHSTGVTPANGTTPEPQFSTSNFGRRSSADDSPILQTAPNKSFKGFPVGSDIFQSTPKAPSVSPFTPVNGLEVPSKPIELAKTFNFTPTPPTNTPTPVLGASVLFGGSTKGGYIPGEGLFGSRPSTPNNAESTTATASIFSNLAKSSSTFSPKNDQTWKAGSKINFGTPNKTSDAPAVNITAATPPAKEENSNPNTFSTLFGNNASSGSTAASGPGSHLGFNFGAPAPGYLGASSHLLPSANSSAFSSRATSPGGTDNESVATNETDDIANDPQTSLMTSRSGEEDEEVLYEGRSKAMKHYDEKEASGKPGAKANEYNTMGVGEVRILKKKGSGKTRILFRAEPSSNIVINSNLVKSVDYTSSEGGKSGTVRFAIITKDGIEKWVLRTKTKEMADELAAIMQKNKAN